MSADTATLAERILAAQTELIAIAADVDQIDGRSDPRAPYRLRAAYHLRQARHTLDLALAALNPQ